MIRKSKINILVIIFIIIMLIAVLATSTYAIWQMTPDAAIYFEMKVGDENPSKKYQLFVPINAEGEKLDGTLYIRRYFEPYEEGNENNYVVNEDYYEDVINENSNPILISEASNIQYYYQLAENESVDDIDSLALVGWNGGIAINKLEVEDIVDSSEYAISDYTFPEEGLKVTHIKVDATYRNYYFRNNSIIKQIIIPANIIRIDAGVFSSMENLESVTINGTSSDESISIGQGAFENCYKLPSINTPEGRIMEEDEL